MVTALVLYLGSQGSIPSEGAEIFSAMLYNLLQLYVIRTEAIHALPITIIAGNEIQKVEGMESLHDLRELVLDRNKIKNINESSFINQWNLQELHMEENRLRELVNFNCLENLQRLYLGSNRIQVSVFLLTHVQ